MTSSGGRVVEVNLCIVEAACIIMYAQSTCIFSLSAFFLVNLTASH